MGATNINFSVSLKRKWLLWRNIRLTLGNYLDFESPTSEDIKEGSGTIYKYPVIMD